MNYEENLKELAKDMTDKEIYEMSKNIVESLVFKKPIIKQMRMGSRRYSKSSICIFLR